MVLLKATFFVSNFLKIESFKKIHRENNVVKIDSINKKKSLRNTIKPKKKIYKGLGRTLWIRKKKIKSN